MIFPSPILDRWAAWDSGARRQISAYWANIAKVDPYFSSVYMCIELVFGDGTTIRIARAPIKTVSMRSGTMYQWQQGLIEEPDISTEVQIGSQAAAARSVNVTIPAKLVDPSAIIARGGMLSGVAEISLQAAGGDYDSRMVLIRGDMVGGFAFGTGSERVQIQISDPRETASLLVPETMADSKRWPFIQDSAMGMRYPIVINGYPKVPCIRVLNDHGGTGLKYLACGDGRNLTISQAYVNGIAASGVYAPWTDTNDRDALGTTCKTVDFSASAGPWEDNDVVYADLELSSGQTSLSAIKTVEYLLRGYTSLGRMGLNPDLFGFADAAMPGYAPKVLINASGESTVQVLDFVESTLLASFPMIHLIYAGRGLGPVVIDRRIGPDGSGAIGVLQGRRELLERTSQYAESAKSDIYNSFSLRYGFNAQDNTYSGLVSRTPSDTAACRLSRSMAGGDRAMDPIDSPYIHTDEMANYVIDWLVAHYALPAYDVDWTVLPSALTRWRVGGNVIYTDPEFSCFTSCPATILSMGYARGKVTMRLRVWHPAWRTLLLGA